MSKSDSSTTNAIIDNFVAPTCLARLEILYQDDDILLINKPSGLLSLSGKNPLNWDSVHYRLVNGQDATSVEKATPSFVNAKLPHRLDLGTSGVMVVGLNPAASKSLNQQFQARTVQKRYLAMLDGWVEADSGQISAPIAKDKTLFPRVKICHDTGKSAISDYQVINRLANPPRTLVQYTPVTGRTHQLRIHSLEFGHPIMGCDLYNNADLNSSHDQQGKPKAEAFSQRLMLHASDIYFTHPTTGEAMHGHSPNPF
ncbi:RNA pseudouridine synthase [Vibrio breoganii]|uniref:RluA family pseudouridine synthase n=1 Tax=Vibrio breoganii TaxID=553239 RepID=UPI0003072398|nr:RluA family pseudouridine synthase [Vibrio breoganii]OCH76171.1 RNA pseudouridine synthase [Vibrio breoganii]OED96448.1 RNA pseudouridine synthase [Vibrio breoganii ZF-29]PMG89423.1 RNA pseudouridine synthase [Vibrio breoganii]PMI19377.1 RNA pseudouridine synthase [Vibrio breoganii]PMK30708.1 RNA pseudouridine synthase [Vibrio breoganii]